jgi:hypothetical protein
MKRSYAHIMHRVDTTTATKKTQLRAECTCKRAAWCWHKAAIMHARGMVLAPRRLCYPLYFVTLIFILILIIYLI